MLDWSCNTIAKAELTYQVSLLNHDYLLVSSSTIEIDLYHKNDTGDWLIINYQAGDTVELKSINLSFPLAQPLGTRIEQVYRNLVLTPESS